MTDRKNLKISPDTYESLREEKGEYETWDGLFHRVFGGGSENSLPNEAHHYTDDSSGEEKIMSAANYNDPKDLGNKALNSILEELAEMRDYQRARHKDAKKEWRAGRLEDRSECIRHYSAADALQRAIDTVVEYGEGDN